MTRSIIYNENRQEKETNISKLLKNSTHLINNPNSTNHVIKIINNPEQDKDAIQKQITNMLLNNTQTKSRNANRNKDKFDVNKSTQKDNKTFRQYTVENGRKNNILKTFKEINYNNTLRIEQNNKKIIKDLSVNNNQRNNNKIENKNLDE